MQGSRTQSHVKMKEVNNNQGENKRDGKNTLRGCLHVLFFIDDKAYCRDFLY